MSVNGFGLIFLKLIHFFTRLVSDCLSLNVYYSDSILVEKLRQFSAFSELEIVTLLAVLSKCIFYSSSAETKLLKRKGGLQFPE